MAWRSAEALIISRAVQASTTPEEEVANVRNAHRLIHVLRRRHIARCALTGWFDLYGRYSPPRPEDG